MQPARHIVRVGGGAGKSFTAVNGTHHSSLGIRESSEHRGIRGLAARGGGKYPGSRLIALLHYKIIALRVGGIIAVHDHPDYVIALVCFDEIGGFFGADDILVIILAVGGEAKQ